MLPQQDRGALFLANQQSFAEKGRMLGLSTRQQPAAPLASFKAGKMKMTPVGEKFRVEADERRGLTLLEKGVDNTLHFIWKDRQTLQTVDDVLVFPGEQVLEKVDTGRPEDRVYLLSFKTSTTRRLFFWMQEPDVSKDENVVAEFNRLMNEANRAGSGVSSRSNPMPSASAAAASTPGVELDHLLRIFRDMGYEGNAGFEEMEEVAFAENSTAAPANEDESQSPVEQQPKDRKDEDGDGDDDKPQGEQ